VTRSSVVILLVALLCTACASTTSGHEAASTDASLTAMASRSTPGAVLADWLHQVVAGDYQAACRDMIEPNGTPAAASACLSGTAHTTLTSLHGNFKIDGLTRSSVITVGPVHVTGNKATVNGTGIHVDGSNLTALMLKHSTGIKPGQLALSFDMSRVRGSWYVAGMNLSV
jgi:hypothetical protein